MISADGWVSWATKLYGNPDHVNGGVNDVRGIFLHSAEGYASVLLDPNSSYGYNGDLSWHFTNLMDGRLFQHFPLTAQCWHATAANDSYVGIENEGLHTKETSLNQAQIKNAVALIEEIAEWKGWTPTRPTSPVDFGATLYEHREVVRFGGSSTACPDGRIPWDTIMAGVAPPPPQPPSPPYNVRMTGTMYLSDGSSYPFAANFDPPGGEP